MEIKDTSIPGVKMIITKTLDDNRGSFFELFRQDLLASEIGAEFKLAQANCSISNKGVIRGIHYAGFPPGQAKYVTCVQGRIQDVFVDLRPDSPKFGKWDSIELSAINHRAIYLPSGVGHAFMSLEDNSMAVYLCDEKYNPSNEFEINPFDSTLMINWNSEVKPILSEKDSRAPSFKEVFNALD